MSPHFILAQTSSYPTAPVNMDLGPQVRKFVRLEGVTRRLRLLRYEEKFLPSLFRFMHDPVAMRFTYVASSIEDCGTRLLRFEAQRETSGVCPVVHLPKGY